MRWAKKPYGCGCVTHTGQTAASSIGGDSLPCASADGLSTTSAMGIRYPRTAGPITPSGRPGTTPTTSDTYADLVMVLAIAGAVGLILAVEALAFVYFAFGGGR